MPGAGQEGGLKEEGSQTWKAVVLFSWLEVVLPSGDPSSQGLGTDTKTTGSISKEDSRILDPILLTMVTQFKRGKNLSRSRRFRTCSSISMITLPSITRGLLSLEL